MGSACATWSVRPCGCVPTGWWSARYGDAEVVDLLAALNTGHEGGCSTVHANSTADVPARLEALGVTAGLSRDAVHSQVAAALRVVVHLQRGTDGVRRVSEIGVLSVGRDGRVHSTPALRTRGVATTPGPAAHTLAELLHGADA